MSDRSARVAEPFGAFGTRAGRLAVRFAPELGGKITGLRLGPDGREWLAPPVRPLRSPAPGQDWGALDCSGWDECLPNIGASADGSLADHGDVWRLPWAAGSTATELVGSVVPASGGYRFERRIETADAVLNVDYSLESLGAAPLDWAWAQHMLLAADRSVRVVASSPMRLRLDSAFRDGVAVSDGFDWLCPDGAPTAEIALTGAEGRAAKLWFEPPVPSVVAVVHGDEWLAWRVGDSSAPDLGLWVNLGGWGDLTLRHVAVEPAFGCYDDPSVSFRGLTPLPVGGRRHWRTVIEAGTDRAGLDRLLSAAPPPCGQ